MKRTTVSITEEQAEWLDEDGKHINLSAFLRRSLDDYRNKMEEN